MKNFILGFSYAFSGFSWILRPKIRRFVYIPLAINILLFALALGLLGKYAPLWVANWLGDKDSWWTLFQWLYDILIPVLTWLAYAVMALIVYFTFSSVANLIAAPFNAQLAKAVEQRLAGKDIAYTDMPLMKEITITVKNELVKLLRFISIAALLCVLLVIPGLNLIFPLAWFIFMAYSLSLQYIDYPMANHQLFYKEQRALLAQNRMQRLGFGVAANVMLLFPLINFIAMPVCVCGATVWWQKLNIRQA